MRKLNTVLVAAVVCWGLIPGVASAVIIHVPADFPTIQGAIDAAAVKGDEIIVAPGTYPEVINFNGKAINLHSASGNPADSIIDGTGLNESVVLCISGEGAGTNLEGFTITGGTGNNTIVFGGAFRGGGMLNISSSPTVTNCTFSGNTVASPGYGGGMFNQSSSPTIANCTFSGNAAASKGGGMYNNSSSSSPTVTNCTFSGNSAQHGGGMYNWSSSPTITNCTFSGNTGSIIGGGMYNWNSSPTITNCIFLANLPGTQIYNSSAGTPVISFSNVQGGIGAGSIDFGGNLNINPGFVDADGPDNIPGTPDDDLHLLPGSLCIDAGDKITLGLSGITTDLEGNPRFVDDPKIVDTGLGIPPPRGHGGLRTAG